MDGLEEGEMKPVGLTKSGCGVGVVCFNRIMLMLYAVAISRICKFVN